MLRGIDHLVIAVRDLGEARGRYEALGFTVVEGGRHPVATHNALIALADGGYIELIAFYEPSPQHRWWQALQRGGGLVDFCAQTDDLRADVAALRRAGVEIDDPVPLSRVRPDGFELQWRLCIPSKGYRGIAPFLIEDETPRAERVPRETAHANGAVGINGLILAVPDVSRPRAWYESILGRPGQSVWRRDLDGRGVRFEVGDHGVELLAPANAGSPLARSLAARGPSPYRAELRAAGDALVLV